MIQEGPSSGVAPRRSSRARKKRAASSDDEDGEAKATSQATQGKPVQQASKRVQTAKPSAKLTPTKRDNNAAADESADEEPPKKASTASKRVRAKTGQPTKGGADQATQSSRTTTKPAKQATDKSASQAAGQAAAAKLADTLPSGSNQVATADPACPKANSSSVFGDFDVMLNQTNIGANNNKFYRMQLLQEASGNADYWLWTRWGRVGDKGQTQLQGPFDDLVGQDQFKKKFR